MPEPFSGRFDGDAHVYPLRVYYEDTDAGGIVYHANYLRFAERARTEMLRLLGHDRRSMGARELMFVVARAAIDYRAPARLDDSLAVVTRLTHLGGASLGLSQTVRRGATDLALIDIRLVCVTSAGRPAPLPDDLRAAFTRVGAPQISTATA